jgi:hypothetical protein
MLSGSNGSRYADSNDHQMRLARAGDWLSREAASPTNVSDTEALIYLTSRGRNCDEQARALVALWKQAERFKLETYNDRRPVSSKPITTDDIADVSHQIAYPHLDAKCFGVVTSSPPE